jgi:hypothetical protein
MDAMTIDALRTLTPAELHDSVSRFKETYVRDWVTWLTVSPERRAALFGAILRRWQATRPFPTRRARADAAHQPPYIDDLLERAKEPLNVVRSLGLSWINSRTTEQSEALTELWSIFSAVSLSVPASGVGISKAVLLASDGQIGPALDSEVRKRLRIPAPVNAREWLDVLDDVAADIRAFERQHGRIRAIVPARHSDLADGRLYDMAFGPKAPV